MDVIWSPRGAYSRASYRTERDLEGAILEVKDEMFGPHRLYLDVKRMIGARGGQQNIPDGYLIDLTGNRPRLFVVENELASHDPLRHIAVQLLQFSLSFESTPLTVRRVLMETLSAQPEARRLCEAYAAAHAIRNLDHLLDVLVHESPFAALVVIDEIPESLERVLADRFRFAVEILELAGYENEKGERLYRFQPFLDAPVLVNAVEGPETVPTDMVDTVVVPGTPTLVEQLLLGERRWNPVRIGGAVRPQIKHLAVYEAQPVSAIRYMVPVGSIDLDDEGRSVFTFAGEPHNVGPIEFAKSGRHPFGVAVPRYTNLERLKGAKTLEDLW